MITTILILLICLPVFAPDERCIYMERPKADNPFEAVMNAVIAVESSGDFMAYNPDEEACGAFQIRPVRVLDYNNRTGKSYILRDCFDYEVSKEIFLYYASLFGPYDIDNCIRAWNGSGKATYEYLRKVKAKL